MSLTLSGTFHGWSAYYHPGGYIILDHRLGSSSQLRNGWTLAGNALTGAFVTHVDGHCWTLPSFFRSAFCHVRVCQCHPLSTSRRSAIWDHLAPSSHPRHSDRWLTHGTNLRETASTRCFFLSAFALSKYPHDQVFVWRYQIENPDKGKRSRYFLSFRFHWPERFHLNWERALDCRLEASLGGLGQAT